MNGRMDLPMLSENMQKGFAAIASNGKAKRCDLDFDIEAATRNHGGKWNCHDQLSTSSTKATLCSSNCVGESLSIKNKHFNAKICTQPTDNNGIVGLNLKFCLANFWSPSTAFEQQPCSTIYKEMIKMGKNISCPTVSVLLLALNMKIAITAVLLVIAAAQGYQQPNYKSSEYNSPMPYSFDWDVNDDASDNHYAHSESSNGHAVTGSYRVALPDGRTQIVTYRADSNGYVADVKYEGQARYPEYKPVSSYSGPAYQAPASNYRAPTPPAYRAPVYRAPAPVAVRRGSTAAPGYVSLPVPLAYRG